MMGIHNFLHRSGLVDESFVRIETDDTVVEVELPNIEDEVHVEMTPKMQ